MTAIDFPNSPTVDDLFTVGDRTWKWTGSVWITVEEAVVGPAGVVASDSEPTSTDVLWLDTDEEPDVPVPTGGTDGQVLTKTSSADYATAWEDIPEGTTVVYSATAPVDTSAIWYSTENGNAYVYYDGFWTSITGLPSIPVGGTTGQVLAKASNTDYATQWVTGSGLELIKTQQIGTAVNSIVVSDAFSATYDNYRVIISGGTASGTISLSIQIGAATAGYYGGSIRVTQASVSSAEGQSNTASYEIGRFAAASNQPSMTIDILAPFLTTRTSFFATSVFGDTSSAGGARWNSGYLNNTTSYTSFTLSYSGTITGGTVYVYGYRNA
jgi:hypothetical protein